MGTHNCETCRFKAMYDANPKNWLGRLWRWHAGFCPGWKIYMNSLTPEHRHELAKKYNLKRYLRST